MNISTDTLAGRRRRLAGTFARIALWLCAGWVGCGLPGVAQAQTYNLSTDYRNLWFNTTNLSQSPYSNYFGTWPYPALTNASSAVYGGSVLDNTGNAIRRIPKLMLKVSPTAMLFADRVRVSLTWSKVGRRFADDANSIELPGFHKLDASLQIDLPRRWKLVLSGDNLTNSAGLTEGNPRTDLSGDPPGTFYMARPLFGRSWHAAISKSFQGD